MFPIMALYRQTESSGSDKTGSVQDRVDDQGKTKRYSQQEYSRTGRCLCPPDTKAMDEAQEKDKTVFPETMGRLKKGTSGRM